MMIDEATAPIRALANLMGLRTTMLKAAALSDRGEDELQEFLKRERRIQAYLDQARLNMQ